MKSQTPANFEDGNYIFLNIGSGRYLGPGNSWGTQASLIESSHYNTLSKLSDGVYSIESQVSNGGTDYYFTGSYMDGAPANVTINEISAGIYTLSANGSYFGYDGASYILASNLTSPDDVNAQWRIVSYDQFYADASSANPVDVTYMILCPNFDRNHRHVSAWTVEASNSNLSGGDNTNRCAESWRSAFIVSQELNVPNGLYQLTAQAAVTEYNVSGTDLPVVFANEETAAFDFMENSETSMSMMSASFTSGMYKVETIEVMVTDGTLKIGVQGSRADTWCCWDNFQLTYYGEPSDLSVLAKNLATVIDDAHTVQGSVPAAAYDALAVVVDENNKEFATAEEYAAAISVIKTATAGPRLYRGLTANTRVSKLLAWQYTVNWTRPMPMLRSKLQRMQKEYRRPWQRCEHYSLPKSRALNLARENTWT